MLIVKWLLLLIALGVVLLVVGARFGLLEGRRPAYLGIKDGQLARPSATPNSVSSQADLWPGHPQRDYARIADLNDSGVYFWRREYGLNPP